MRGVVPAGGSQVTEEAEAEESPADHVITTGKRELHQITNE